MQTINIEISKLKNNTGQIEGVPKNPRFIKDEKYKQLVQSIKDDPEMLELREVIAYDNSGELVVIAGNMRLRACKELGKTEIPAKILPTEIPARKLRAFAIKDNVPFGENSWDDLANDWDMLELEEWGMDLPDSFKPDKEITEDEAPEVDDTELPKSKLGEIYQLGKHRVMCGDSTDKNDVSLLMGGGKADMCFTDPPYGVDYSSRVDKNRRKPCGTILNDDLKDESLRDFLFDTCSDIEDPKYICCNWQSVADFMLALGKPNAFIVWDKGSIGLGAGYRNQHEIILFYGKLDHNSESNVWSIKRDSSFEYDHPTQKPVAISARAIKNSSKSGNIVLDIFLGSGSTLIACEQMGRICYGMELDPKYVDVIRKRYWMYINEGNEDGWEDGTPRIEDI